MSYRTTERANLDIYSIYLYGLENFGRDQAEKYGGQLFDCFDLLSKLPLVARERIEYEPPYRVHFHGAHAIFYLLEGEDVLIVRVLHASQDWRRHL